MELNQKLVNKYILEGQFGLEKESLRVSEDGFLSHIAHPFFDIPQIDRDFCENQIEIITGVHDSVEGVYEELTELHNTAVKRLYHLKSGKEYVWNFSNPPYVKNEGDIPVAKFSGKLKGKEIYRKYLSKKYGKKKMLYSGIHFNFSFSEDYLQTAFENSTLRDFTEFKNQLYLNLAQKVVRHGWLIVYLTAASPLMDGSFIDYERLGEDVLSPYASGRCSEIGYWNDFVPILKYDNLGTYIDSIQEYVDLKQIRSASELYYPVRLKPKGENTLENLRETEVNHIELRNIDLNPLSDIGLKKEDVAFLHLLLVYLNLLENKKFEDFEQVMAIKNIKNAAKFNDDMITIETKWNESQKIKTLTLQILNDMEAVFQKIDGEKTKDILAYQKNKVLNRRERYAAKIMHTFEGGYVKQGLRMAEEYAKKQG